MFLNKICFYSKIKTLIFVCFVFYNLALCAQYNVIAINKQLKDFPDIYDLSTPLNAGVTILYSSVHGNSNIWRDASVYMSIASHRKGTISNRIVDENTKTKWLNTTIEEVIVYQDSIAGMITRLDTDYYSIRWLCFEDNKWLNMGEDERNRLEEVREMFYIYAPDNLSKLHRSNVVKLVSTDTLAFVNYVKQHGIEPKSFLLEALATYPLVIYGEIHRRKISWDLLSALLLDPRFPETVGTVFIEMPAYQQPEFDRFYASKELDTEIILDIMRSFQVSGWCDRGEYEFLINVWKLNQTLPVNRQIRVIATDEQAPWKLLKTSEDFKEYEKNAIDRNTRMADAVEQTIKTKTDKRNCLFIAGYGHAYKSHVPGSYSSVKGQEPALSAGAQLVQRLSNKNVFTILQHAPMIRNVGGAVNFVRQGLFDAVFEKTGNQPIAFNLSDSPFGAEPYDADFDDAFDSKAGNYTDNFDGYIFLQPLKDEDTDYILYDIWSDQFINEIKRRETLTGWKLYRWIDGELTKEKIIETFKEDEDKKRWSELFE
jgi:hypothetical protein